MTNTTRRDFLKTSGVIAAGAAMGSQLAPRVHAAENGMIKIALVGCGGRGGGAAVNALSTNGPTKLHAMADVFEDRLNGCHAYLSKDFGERIDVPKERMFHGFDSYRKAIDCLDPGDVVILATACGFRPMHVEYAVEKGVNIFMEKPFATDSPGTKRIAEAARKADAKNIKIACGLMWRHCKARSEAVERIHNGEIGDVLQLRGFRMHGPYGIPKRAENQSELAYQIRCFHYFDWVGANVFIDYCIHNIDVACWAKGAWPVSAMGLGGRSNPDVPGQGFDTYYTEFTFPDGSHLTSHGRYRPNCYDQYSDFAHGTKGSCVIMDNLGAAKSRIYKNQIMKPENMVWQHQGEEPNPYQTEHDLLFDAIRNDKPYNEGHRAAEAQYASLLSRAAYNSGKIVTWDEIVNSKLELFPGGIDNISWDSVPPVAADTAGKYTYAIPGDGVFF